VQYLAISCKRIFKILKPYIEDHFVFGYNMHKNSLCKVYAPKNMKCDNYDILLNHPSVMNVVSIKCCEIKNLDFFPPQVIHLRFD